MHFIHVVIYCLQSPTENCLYASWHMSLDKYHYPLLVINMIIVVIIIIITTIAIIIIVIIIIIIVIINVIIKLLLRASRSPQS